MFKKRQQGDQKRKVEIVDEEADQPTTDRNLRTETASNIVSEPNLIANAHETQRQQYSVDVNQEPSSNTFMHLEGPQEGSESISENPQSAFLRLKNKNQRLSNVFSVGGHANRLVLDDSRLLAYDNLKAEETEKQSTEGMIIEELGKPYLIPGPASSEKEIGLGLHTEDKTDLTVPVIQNANFRVSTSRLDSYINLSQPIKYKPLDSGSDEQTQHLIHSNAGSRSKADLAAYYSLAKTVNDEDEMVSDNLTQAEKMKAEFRARKFEQELERHKNSSASRFQYNSVHRVADDIAATDVGEINIAMTTKSYARCDADMVEEIGESPKEVEEFEMYEKFILQNAVKNSRIAF